MGDSAYRSILRCGFQLQGRRCEAEAYEEVRPDVGFGHCNGWGLIELKCERASARCVRGVLETARYERAPVPG